MNGVWKTKHLPAEPVLLHRQYVPGSGKGINHGRLFINVHARGGQLKVSFFRNDSNITDIWLEGPATFVFQGTINLAT